VRERGRSVAQASRDVHENVLRKWMKEFGADPKQAFPGHGGLKPSSWSTDPSGRWHGFAKRSAYRGLASILAETRPQRSLAGGRSDHAGGQGELRGERPHLWRASDLAQRAGSRPYRDVLITIPRSLLREAQHLIK
jgi:glyoxylase-like metal-dependent hydrolase (beta-lactamase superfamily II)